MRPLLLLAPGLLATARMCAVEHEAVVFEGKRCTVSRVDLRRESLELFLRDEQGSYFNRFAKLEAALAAKHRRLVFAVNAGMFHPGFGPVGLFIDDGRMSGQLNVASAEGNFFLKPNGVFAVTGTGAAILESSRFPAFLRAHGLDKIKVATQSGPLLVIDGNLPPAFRRESTSVLSRNGVGIRTPKEVVFAISEEPVNFHAFARLFRDRLKCRNALFLDGTLSSLHASELKRSDFRMDLGPILGVTTANPR